MNEVVVRGTWVGEAKPSDVLIADGKVTALHKASKRRPDVGSRHTVLAPPLVDVQINGVGGVDLQSESVTAEDVGAITKLLAKRGVGTWIPTVITGSRERMERACRVIAEARTDRRVKQAVPGIHVEGPYISPEDGPRGAHAKEHVRRPSLREFDRLQKASEENILYTTLAPEVPGAIRYIKGVVARGVKAALGHHAATTEQIDKAVEAGAVMSTHLGNGVASMIHRHENPLWPQLATDRLAASVIPDLHHIAPDILKTIVRAKTPERIILTSDSVHLAGMKPGHYDVGGVPVELKRSGKICLTGTDLLAGSSLDLLQGVVNAVQVTDLTIEEAVYCATRVPARVLGIPGKHAKPKTGEKAHFIAFDIDKSNDRWEAALRALFLYGQRIDFA